MRHPQRLAFLPLAAALLVAACGSSSTPSPAASAAPTAAPTAAPSALGAADLSGRTWNLASITEKNPPWQGGIPPEQQVDYTANFNPDLTILVRGDCNQASGTFTADASGAATISFGPTTLAFCGEDSFSSLYLDAMSRVTNWAVSGTVLTLTINTGGTLSFVQAPPNQTPAPSKAPVTPAPTASAAATATASASAAASASATAAATASPTPAPTATPAPTPKPTAAPTATQAPTSAASGSTAPTAAPTAEACVVPSPSASGSGGATAPTLTGTAWQLASITLIDPAVSCEVPQASRASYTLKLADDGTFAAKADCKDVAGTYTSSESGTLQLVPGPVSMIACPPGSFSDLYIAGLGKVKLWAITNNLLVLSNAGGDSLTFEPQPAP